MAFPWPTAGVGPFKPELVLVGGAGGRGVSAPPTCLVFLGFCWFPLKTTKVDIFGKSHRCIRLPRAAIPGSIKECFSRIELRRFSESSQSKSKQLLRRS